MDRALQISRQSQQSWVFGPRVQRCPPPWDNCSLRPPILVSRDPETATKNASAELDGAKLKPSPNRRLPSVAVRVGRSPRRPRRRRQNRIPQPGPILGWVTPRVHPTALRSDQICAAFEQVLSTFGRCWVTLGRCFGRCFGKVLAVTVQFRVGVAHDRLISTNLEPNSDDSVHIAAWSNHRISAEVGPVSDEPGLAARSREDRPH